MIRRLALQFGIGVDLRGEDATAAARRAAEDAIRRNGVTVAAAFGAPPGAMIVEVRVGVPGAASVDRAAVAAVFAYGRVTVEPVEGGLRSPKPEGGATLLAAAVVSVSLDLEEAP